MAVFNPSELGRDAQYVPDTEGDAALVRSYYQNYLGRAGDDPGVAFWVGVLGNNRVQYGDTIAISELQKAFAKTAAEAAADRARTATPIPAVTNVVPPGPTGIMQSAQSQAQSATFSPLLLIAIAVGAYFLFKDK